MIHTTPSIVRTAKPMDAPEIWRLFLQVHRENGLFSIAPHKVTMMMDRALHPEAIPPTDIGPRACIGVIGPMGRLEGLSFVLISSFWYSEDLHLEELLVYVDPECRRSGHARALVAWMKNLADSLKIPLMTGIISKQRTAAKIRLYDRMLPRIGAFYLYPQAEDSDLIKPETVMGNAVFAVKRPQLYK
jgi:hypothetical protein